MRYCFRLFYVGLIFLSGLLISHSIAETKQPNVVVILTDDQGYADISLSEHAKPEVKTPRMDRLLQEGARFTKAHTSGATCSPTRAGIMTGNYQQRHGIYHTPDTRQGLDLNVKLMPQYFKDHGYATACIGKWHLGLTEEYNPINRGFDYFYGFLGHGGHDYFKLGSKGAKDEEFNGMKRNLEPIEDQGYLTTRIGDESVEWIEKNKDKPFFLFVCFNAVHSPAQAPEEDIAKHNTGDKTRDTLLAMLDHLDLNVGRIVDELKKHDLYDNTLIFTLTDNGGAKKMKADNTPLRGAKGSIWEGGHRTFFGVTWKDRIKPGTVVEAPIMSFDILPTALAAADIPIPEDKIIDGKNLLPLIAGEVDQVHDYLIWYNARGPAAVYQDGWKFTREVESRKNPVPKESLFYLPKDIGEEQDLASENQVKREELLAILEQWKGQMKPLSKKQARLANFAGSKEKQKNKAKK